LQQQVENALDRGKMFRNKLEKEGANETDLSTVMNHLENKMQKVEDLLQDDRTRQNDTLSLKLAQRKNRRKNLQSKLTEVKQRIDEKEKEVVVAKDRIMT